MWSVGLLQREIEQAGFSTIILTNNPELTASVSVPRIAAIEFPNGCTTGYPGDEDTQREVLREVLSALITIQVPGGMVHLPFRWDESRFPLNENKTDPPPISLYLRKHIFQIPRLMKRDIPNA